MLGLMAVGLLPSAPWHAAQTSLTIACAFARSGFAAGACASVTVASQAPASAASVRKRFIGLLLEGAAGNAAVTPVAAPAWRQSNRAKSRPL
jgi:hypothetical protein